MSLQEDHEHQTLETSQSLDGLCVCTLLLILYRPPRTYDKGPTPPLRSLLKTTSPLSTQNLLPAHPQIVVGSHPCSQALVPSPIV